MMQAQKDNLESINNRRKEIIERRKEISIEPEMTKKRITVSTESINFGQIIEKIVPSIKTFPYKQKDCRQLFDPIDYIVFNGLHNNGNINELNFIDVKSGNARLKPNQKDIKNTIEAGKLQYLNVEDITNE
jgi:predicted Holliday junction resolvase-like endonuclease